MDYKMITYVHDSGFAETGISALINDRDTSVSVPWEVSNTSQTAQNIEWVIESDNGTTYKVTIPVRISYDSATQKSTATYIKGTYTITTQQSGGT